MRPFDVATWTSIVILVVGSSGIFLWFLKDAGRVLRGDGSPAPKNEEEPGDGPEEGGVISEGVTERLPRHLGGEEGAP